MTITIEMTDSEMELAKNQGQNFAHFHASKPYFAKNIRGGNAADKKTQMAFNKETGRLAEMALAKYLDYPFDKLHMSTQEGDGGKDIEIGGRTIDVKGTVYDGPSPRLTIEPYKQKKPLADLLILCCVSREKKTVRLVGWISREDFMANREIVQNDDGKLMKGTWLVRQKDLKPVEDFLLEINR